MPVVKVQKNKGYTTMSNYHLRDKELSLKAKGVMSIMLSLPTEWDYSIAGLSKLCKDGRDSVANALKELEKFGYLTRKQINNGKFGDIEYTLFERPYSTVEEEKQEECVNVQPIEKKPRKKREAFIKPTLEEVTAYIKEKGLNVNAERFMNYYDSNGWMVGRYKMKDWQATIRGWENRSKEWNSNNNDVQLPDWYDNLPNLSESREELLKRALEVQQK